MNSNFPAGQDNIDNLADDELDNSNCCNAEIINGHCDECGEGCVSIREEQEYDENHAD